MKNTIKYTDSLLPVIDKNTVLEQLASTSEGLSENIQPLIASCKEYFSDDNLPIVKENVAIASKFFKAYKGVYRENKMKPVLGLLGALDLTVMTAIEQIKTITELTDGTMVNKVTSDSIDVKNIVLLKLSDYMSYLESSITDLLVYIVVMQTRAAKHDNKDGSLILPKFKEKSVMMSIHPLGRLSGFLGELSFKGIEKDFNAIEKGMVITKGNTAGTTYAEKELAKQASGLGNMPTIAGFIGNPVYHLRMVIADWQVARNEERKDYKRTIELKILYLKSLQKGDENPKLEKEISYYEKKASKLEYQINKMEQE